VSSGLKSAVTLVGLSVLLVGAAAWGWSQVTEPFPGKVEPPPCVDTAFAAGEKIYPQDVTVSVLNASDREGLASFTLQSLADQGFDEGETGNAPTGTDVSTAEIWTTGERNKPAIALLRSRLEGERVRRDVGELTVPGVVLVVGDQFGEVTEGTASVTAEEEAVVCGPPLD